MVSIQPFDPDVHSVEESWTFPAYRHLLSLEPSRRFAEHGRKGTVHPLGAVALSDHRPVGLALGCLPLDADDGTVPDAELLSLYVASEYRCRGIATALVSKIESWAATWGAEAVSTVYMTGSQAIVAVERLLGSRGWNLPRPRMLVMRGTLREAMSIPSFGRYRLRAGFEILPWGEVTEAELAGLRAHDARTPWIAEDLRPWRYDTSYLDPASSLAVRLDAHLVGWVLNHRMDPRKIRVTCAFMRPDLARRARILPVLTESVIRAHAAGYEHLLWTVPYDHQEMVRFTRRWFSPYLSFSGETRTSHKSLTADPLPGTTDRALPRRRNSLRLASVRT